MAGGTHSTTKPLTLVVEFVQHYMSASKLPVCWSQDIRSRDYKLKKNKPQ